MSRDFDLQEFERIEPLEDIEEETTFIKEVVDYKQGRQPVGCDLIIIIILTGEVSAL